LDAVENHNRRSGVRGLLGGVLLGLGAVLLLASGAYYAYGAWAGSRLDELNVARERPAPIESPQPGGAVKDGIVVQAADSEESLKGGDSAAASIAALSATEGPSDAANAPTAEAAGVVAGTYAVDEKVEVKQAEIASPGVAIASATAAGTENPAGGVERTEPLGLGGWLDPRSAESTQAAVQAASSESDAGRSQTIVVPDPRPALLARMFDASRAEAATYNSPSIDDLGAAGMGPATRIRIPVLNIDTEIKELEVVRAANSSAWETPKHVVGHIPTTPVPGGNGQGWYFGHLESPIRGEGNVFQRLPEIVDMLAPADGPPIYVFLETEDRKFVYQVYLTVGMPQEELRISDSGVRDITLVTCTPRFVYDQRLLVTAALVGVLDS
jgi:sortase (surface protein transpeptidase)